MSATFSVVLITHNQKAFAAQALRSILDARHDDIEIICVDDSSTDGTGELLYDVARRTPCMRVVRHPHTGKPSVLRNAGLDASTAEWVSFLDGDDLYHGDRFAAMRAAIARRYAAPDVLVHNHIVFVESNPELTGAPRITPDLESRMLAEAGDPSPTLSTDDGVRVLNGDRLGVFLLAETFLLHTSSFCVRRTLLEQRAIRFDETRVYGEDHPFILDCVVGSRVAYLPQSLSFYRRHGNSLTAERTARAQTELLASMHEQVRLLERRTPHALRAVNREAIRDNLLSEALHLGYLYEKTGHTRQAVSVYLRETAQLRAPVGWLRAAKALIRKPR